jgi:hypothetical protein
LGAIVALTVAVSLLYGWFMTFVVGQYYMSATIILTVLYGIIWPIIIVYGTYRAIRWLMTANLPTN